MRYISLFCLIITPFFYLHAQLPSFPSVNVQIRDTVRYPGQSLANVWGYAAGGNEYALVGAKNGMSIVNITNPDNAQHVLTIPGPSNLWKEIKTYINGTSAYAYIATEGGGGLQIVNLTGLTPSSTSLPYYSYTNGGTIDKIHALQVDEAKGILYLFGGDTPGAPRVYNLLPNPYAPTYVGSFTANGYCHDGYANNDTLYSGHIYAGQFAVVVKNGATFSQVGSPTSTPGNFTHNTWKYGNTLFTTDEVNNSYLTSFDLTTRDILDKIQSNPGSNSMVHNTYIKNGYAITSWYKDGFTITDVSRPSNMVQVGSYDTYTGAGTGSSGCWGVYPFFPSGNIIASNIYGTGANSTVGELYICTPTYTRACYVEGAITQPNPLNGSLPPVALSGALVELLSTTTNETTPVSGLYKMGQLTPGNYTLRVSKSGFVTHNQAISIATGTLTTVDVLLQPVVLPVELKYFKAVLSGKNTAELSWATATERLNKGFDIEHSTDITHWEAIQFVPGAGDADHEIPYAAAIHDLRPGTHYFRLAQVDTDGKRTYSDWQSVLVSSGELNARLLPNIVQELTTLVIEPISVAQQVNIEVLNSGMQATNLHWSVELDDQALRIPLVLSELPIGTYFVVLKTTTAQMTLTLVKTQ